MAERKVRWGWWIYRRAEHVGFKRQLDFARAVGVSPQHLRRWMLLMAPPKQMRRGLDDALARALRTDRRTLFTDWTSGEPDEFPIVRTDERLGVPWDSAAPESERIVEQIVTACRSLTAGELARVATLAMQLQTARSEKVQRDLAESIRRLEIAKRTGTWPATAAEQREHKKRG